MLTLTLTTSTCGLQVRQLAPQRQRVGGDAHVAHARQPRQRPRQRHDVLPQRRLAARQPDLRDPGLRKQPRLPRQEQPSA